MTVKNASIEWSTELNQYKKNYVSDAEHRTSLFLEQANFTIPYFVRILKVNTVEFEQKSWLQQYFLFSNFIQNSLLQLITWGSKNCTP